MYSKRGAPRHGNPSLTEWNFQAGSLLHRVLGAVLWHFSISIVWFGGAGLPDSIRLQDYFSHRNSLLAPSVVSKLKNKILLAAVADLNKLLQRR